MTTNSVGVMTVYVGTYTHSLPHVEGKARGIGVYRLDLATGALTLAHVLEDVINPSYLVLDRRHRYLWCVEEMVEGRVSAFSIDPVTGIPIPRGHELSQGSGPAHVSVDRGGQWILVANYDSGSVAVLPILEDGGLGPATAVVRHAGWGPRLDRQEGPHAHWIGADPADRFVLVADLGLDAIVGYRLDTTSGALTCSDAPVCTLQPGSGPRHLAFRPDGRYVYVINELDSTLGACAYDALTGELRPLQSVSTVPDDFTGTNWTAAVRVDPEGRFVYGSNRGHDTIVIFASDQATGLLTLVGHESTQGHAPRDFNIDPTGTFLLVANQDSGTVVTFRIDGATGRLHASGQTTEVETPACIAFGPMFH